MRILPSVILVLLVSACSPNEPLIDGRYALLKDGQVVEDQNNELQWMRCTLGQQWNSEAQACQGEATLYTYEEALNISLDYADHSDWRVPTISELRSLVYCSTGLPARLGMPQNFKRCSGSFQRPTIIKEAFPDTPLSRVWSSTPSEIENEAWFASMYFGYIHDGAMGHGLHVRMVRTP